MRYTIKLANNDKAEIEADAGRVTFNGKELAPHEAIILADAISDCARIAERKAGAAVQLMTEQREARESIAYTKREGAKRIEHIVASVECDVKHAENIARERIEAAARAAA